MKLAYDIIKRLLASKSRSYSYRLKYKRERKKERRRKEEEKWKTLALNKEKINFYTSLPYPLVSITTPLLIGLHTHRINQ